jgi:hypothetical protein
MKRFLTFIAVVVLVVGGGIAAFRPNTHFRLYDANMRPLALTHAETYCTGYWGILNGFRDHDPDVIACQVDGKMDNLTPDVTLAVVRFCEGIRNAGWQGTVDDCINIVERDELWPLLDGGITMQWNSGHPRPTTDEGSIVVPNRGAGRTGNGSRGNIGTPTETTAP